MGKRKNCHLFFFGRYLENNTDTVDTLYNVNTVTFDLSGLHPIIGEKISIRVNGIDTPEIKGKCEKEKYDAQQAREMVREKFNFL